MDGGPTFAFPAPICCATREEGMEVFSPRPKQFIDFFSRSCRWKARDRVVSKSSNCYALIFMLRSDMVM